MTEIARQGSTAVARPRTFLHFVLDESPSMEDVCDVTISSVNEFLQSQRRARIDELFVTVTKFNDKTKTLYHRQPIEKVWNLTRKTYQPDGWGTALYDGMYRAMTLAEKETSAGDRILVVVITDGDDNCSGELDIHALKRMVQERERRGNWTFVYLGSNLDPFGAGQRLGFRAGNVDSYTATADGVQNAIAKVDAAVKSYRASDDLTTDTFYNQPKKWNRPQWANNPDVVLTDEE